MPKQYAHLQTMTLSPVNFQKNQSKTIGDVPFTRCLLLEGGQKDGQTDVGTKGLNAEYYVASLFFEKARDNNDVATYHRNYTLYKELIGYYMQSVNFQFQFYREIV